MPGLRHACMCCTCFILVASSCHSGAHDSTNYSSSTAEWCAASKHPALQPRHMACWLLQRCLHLQQLLVGGSQARGELLQGQGIRLCTHVCAHAWSIPQHVTKVES